MAEARTAHLTLTDAAGTGIYGLPIYHEKGERALKFSPRPSQPSDPQQPWRKAVHPWHGGIAADRLERANTYIVGDCDASYGNMLLRAPRAYSVTMTNGNLPSKAVEFNSLVFLLGGRYMYYYNPAAGTVTEDKDFGAGKAAIDMAVFNSELVVAMGESEKLYTRNTAGTWTQATDNTFAIALGVVNSQLWRAESTNKISNCITAPRTLTSWAPASPNQYTVGDTTYAINTIIDYNGAIYVGKGDGMYAVDPTFKFNNQTPQLKVWPHTDNCKGSFIAHGALWMPSSSGLIRIKGSSSKVLGPEKTGKPGYRFWVRGGLEFGGIIYLLVTDEAAALGTAIYKMVRDQYDPNLYTYHEWGVFDTTKGYCITVSTVGTNPQLIYGLGNNVNYIKLGRAGGRDVDDANYEFDSSSTFESGLMQLTEDLSIPAIIQGAEILLIQPHAYDQVTLSVSDDRETQSYTLLYSETASATAIITGQTTYAMVRRFLITPLEAQLASVKVASANTSATSKQVIREIWLFGWSRPKVVDEITVAIPCDGLSLNAFGGAIGKSPEELYNLFRGWYNTSEILTIELPDYAESDTVKVLVSAVELTEQTPIPGEGEQSITRRILAVKLQRLFPLGLA